MQHRIPLSSLSTAGVRAFTAITVLVFAVVGAAQAWAGLDVPVWVVTLPMVALCAWATSMRHAALASAIGMASWVVSVMLIAPDRLVNPLWHVSMILRAVTIVLVILLAAGWRRTVQREHELERMNSATGLVTAREFYRLVDVELQRAQRYENPFTIVYMSVEGYASVEQRGGHEAGERLLSDVGQILASTTRKSDTIAWLRGAEIGVLMPETGPTGASQVLARVRERLDTELTSRRLTPAVSVGAVTWIRTSIPTDQLLQRAYQMLYAARQNTGDRFRHEVLDTEDVVL